MTARLAHAARNARYAMMVGYQLTPSARETMFKKCCDELVAGLEEYESVNPMPARPKLREFGKFDAGLGSYLDTVEEFSQ